MHPGVIVDLEALDRIDVRSVPPRFQLTVVVHSLQQLAQLAVGSVRRLDAHLSDRLARRQLGLLGGLDRLRRFESFELLVVVHSVHATASIRRTRFAPGRLPGASHLGVSPS